MPARQVGAPPCTPHRPGTIPPPTSTLEHATLEHDPGPAGEDGEQGAPGEQGEPGAVGPIGPVGPSGSSQGNSLQVVDSTGEVVGTLATVFNNSAPWVGVAVGDEFVRMTIEGRQLDLEMVGGVLYFESDDCSGPPAAAIRSRRTEPSWFGYEPAVWPPSGTDRLSYELTTIDESWNGTSTRFNSRYNSDPFASGCVSGPQGVEPDPSDPDEETLTEAFAVAEVPDGLIIKEYVGPLSVQVAP